MFANSASSITHECQLAFKIPDHQYRIYVGIDNSNKIDQSMSCELASQYEYHQYLEVHPLRSRRLLSINSRTAQHVAFIKTSAFRNPREAAKLHRLSAFEQPLRHRLTRASFCFVSTPSPMPEQPNSLSVTSRLIFASFCDIPLLFMVPSYIGSWACQLC